MRSKFTGLTSHPHESSGLVPFQNQVADSAAPFLVMSDVDTVSKILFSISLSVGLYPLPHSDFLCSASVTKRLLTAGDLLVSLSA